LSRDHDEGDGCTGSDRGLALLPGLVRRFPEVGLKVPQTGWNRLHLRERSALFRWIRSGSFVYFNHGYYCDPDQSGTVSAYSDYGIRYAAAVQRSPCSARSGSPWQSMYAAGS